MNLFFLSRKRFLILFILGFSALNQGLFAQDFPPSPPIGEIGHSIKVIYPGHAGSQIILGHYYDYMVLGKEQNTFDEKSTVEFSSPSPLPGGVYTFVVDGQVVQGDFIVE